MPRVLTSMKLPSLTCAMTELDANQFFERASPLIGLSEVDMLNRVVMLKRMKRLLIGEWHPIIDVLLGDYERDLKRVRLLREPEDDADGGIDVLDQDME